MTAKWAGRCGECQAWGTVEEVDALAKTARTQPSRISVADRAPSISSIDATTARHRRTDVPELDRVLGGGLIPGGVILMAGEPGTGKSTLVLDVASKVAQQVHNGKPRTVLYITGEESAAQVRMRADRIGAVTDNLLLSAENDLGRALGQIEETKPDLFIVDSVQTLQSAEAEGSAGGVTQIREVTNALINSAKTSGATAILIGHVTKDGSIAGPRLLEHLVDVVCQFEGDRFSTLRLVRAVKNRYGSTDEVGCFEMREDGIHSVEDPSGLFRTTEIMRMPGAATTVALEGRRPLISEVQALANPSEGGNPRRTVQGLENSRVNMILAVLQRRVHMNLSKHEVFASTVGGIKISEPAADLAIAAAIASAFMDQTIPENLVLFGEIGLSGEVRAVPGIQRRINEAARLGFTHAVVPSQVDVGHQLPPNFHISRAKTVAQALTRAFDAPATPRTHQTSENQHALEDIERQFRKIVASAAQDQPGHNG